MKKEWRRLKIECTITINKQTVCSWLSVQEVHKFIDWFASRSWDCVGPPFGLFLTHVADTVKD